MDFMSVWLPVVLKHPSVKNQKNPADFAISGIKILGHKGRYITFYELVNQTGTGIVFVASIR
jgi:hypothetical protein